MLKHFQIIIQYLLPKQLLTRFMGWLANKPLGIVTTWFIKLFIWCYYVDLTEAEKTSPEDYRTFNDFFARRLTANARPITAASDELTFPCDGVISQLGQIENEQLLQAKGHYYSLEQLLACNPLLVDTFTNGLFMTTYLSPKDYHRVHMPCNGQLSEMIYVPGSLFSVNKNTTENIESLFARNERLICIFDTPFGKLAQILVGATIVGSIETIWHGIINKQREGLIQRWTYPTTGNAAISLLQGEEMGLFKLGSTVINLFQDNQISLLPEFMANSPTHFGSVFAKKIVSDTIKTTTE